MNVPLLFLEKIKQKLRYLVCLLIYLGSHDWTCLAEQGIKPTEKQLNDGIEGFNDYAKMYCKYCGYVYIPYDQRKK